MAVLVGRVVGDVDPFAVIPFAVPSIEECADVVAADRREEGGDLRIAVDFHAFSEQRMIVCVVGIILTCVVLAYDGIGGQIQQEGSLFCEDSIQHTLEPIVLDDLPDDQRGADAQAAAPLEAGLLLGDLDIGKVPEEVLVGEHQGGVFLALLAYGGPLGDVESPDRIIGPLILEVDVDGVLDSLANDLSRNVGHLDKEIEIHNAPPK